MGQTQPPPSRSKQKGLKAFYTIYQFVVPLVFFPYAYWLWWQRLDHNHAVTILILFVPVVAYYIFVMVGIMHFHLWRMNTWPTVHGFRPHHGFVFGTAAALLAYLILRMVPVDHTGVASVITTAFLGASVFGFWNWWYETYAIKSGFISIFTKSRANGVSVEEAVTDYAPILFGTFGACCLGFVKTAENLLLQGASSLEFWLTGIIGGLGIILIPAGVYLAIHRIRYGESGLISYKDVIESQNPD